MRATGPEQAGAAVIATAYVLWMVLLARQGRRIPRRFLLTPRVATVIAFPVWVVIWIVAIAAIRSIEAVLR